MDLGAIGVGRYHLSFLLGRVDDHQEVVVIVLTQTYIYMEPGMLIVVTIRCIYVPQQLSIASLVPTVKQSRLLLCLCIQLQKVKVDSDL